MTFGSIILHTPLINLITMVLVYNSAQEINNLLQQSDISPQVHVFVIFILLFSLSGSQNSTTRLKEYSVIFTTSFYGMNQKI